MISQKQYDISKINFNFSASQRSDKIKRGNRYEQLSKRLKYSFNRKYEHSVNDPCNIKFNDSKFFIRKNQTIESDLRESNLFRRKSTNTRQYSLQHNKNNEQTKRTNSTKIINIGESVTQQLDNISIKQKVMSHQSTPKNQQKSLYYVKNSSSRIQNHRKHTYSINPYTHQQYLYFRTKQREDERKTYDDIKKKQLQLNILKPCQVFRKQLNNRSSNSRVVHYQQKGRPKTARYQKTKGNFNREPSIGRNSQENNLQPWQIQIQDYHM